MTDYFPDSDFEKCDPPCNKDQMNGEFLDLLNQAREISAIPFIPTSAFRSIEHELAKGRDGTSSHTKGVAIDLKVVTSRQRYIIVNALLKVGFNRIGIGEGFIHVDNDMDKDQAVIWEYY